MRILHLMKDFNIGGVQISVLDFLSNCPSSIDNVPIENFLICAPGELKKRLNQNIIYRELQTDIESPMRILFNAFKIARYVKANKIDIIHAYNRPLAWTAYFVCKILHHKIKFVTTISGFYRFGHLIRKFISKSLVLSDAIISPSKCLADNVTKAYNIQSSKIHIIPEGVIDETDRCPKGSQILNRLKSEHSIDIVECECKIILCLTRISKIKGLEVLVKALPLISANHVCFFITPTKESRYYNRINRLIKQYHVKAYFLDSSYKFLIKYSDVIVCPSTREESFGRVPVEAAFFKKIAVASNIGGFKEVIVNNQTGFLFENKNPNQLAGKINKVFSMDHDEYMKMAESANQFVTENFNIITHVIKKLTLYKNLLNNK